MFRFHSDLGKNHSGEYKQKRCTHIANDSNSLTFVRWHNFTNIPFTYWEMTLATLLGTVEIPLSATLKIRLGGYFPSFMLFYSCSKKKFTCGLLNPMARTILHFSGKRNVNLYLLQKSLTHTELADFFSELNRFFIPFAVAKSYASFPISDLVESKKQGIELKNMLK